MADLCRLHDEAHTEASRAMERWTRAYLDREGCGHCFGCPHAHLEHYIEDAYISIQCHHPHTIQRVESGEFENVLEHNPGADCPIESLRVIQEMFEFVKPLQEAINDRNGY